MCKFLHIRPYAPIHHRNNPFGHVKSNKGGVTVAYEVEEGTLRYAIARCSLNDNFCRKTGRTLAAGRLKSDRLSTTIDANAALHLQDTENIEEVLRTIVQL